MEALLDGCYRHLESQGFGPLELATLEVSDSEDIAKQLAFELNLPFSEAMVEALAIWIQGAKAEAGLLQRASGLLADDVAWHLLAPTPRCGPICVEETRPPPGIKAKKLVQDGQELAARESWLQEVWTKKLVEELRAADAPVLEKLPGSTHPNTLKRYVGIYRLWRMYLQESRRPS